MVPSLQYLTKWLGDLKSLGQVAHWGMKQKEGCLFQVCRETCYGLMVIKYSVLYRNRHQNVYKIPTPQSCLFYAHCPGLILLSFWLLGNGERAKASLIFFCCRGDRQEADCGGRGSQEDSRNGKASIGWTPQTRGHHWRVLWVQGQAISEI